MNVYAKQRQTQDIEYKLVLTKGERKEKRHISGMD